MRIISGKYRGLKLTEFEGYDIRPTADRVKESLFNILSEKVFGVKVLDLFCGSGNLGMECISRGAAEVRFNDCSQKSLQVLKTNLAKLKEEKGYKITCLDFAACLNSGEKYDLIFIDPPYKSDAGVSALRIIGQRGLLNAGGVAVLERDLPFEGEVGGLTVYDTRKYGRTYLTFFKGTGDN